MFIAAVARPRYFPVIVYDLSKLIFSHYIVCLLFGSVNRYACSLALWIDMTLAGKIGIWAFAKEYEAKRTSKNRRKGALVLRNVETVDRAAYKATLINDIIPAIKAQWPLMEKKRTNYIQQGNAKPHVLIDDPDVVSAGYSCPLPTA